MDSMSSESELVLTWRCAVLSRYSLSRPALIRLPLCDKQIPYLADVSRCPEASGVSFHCEEGDSRDWETD
ncbi:hypothetical protein CCHR01_16201 [Colletotrichum chrysophilum]|uniref:Uncharacterized protein n=1 Tax=Colletotrichum chrysophilum TaxID=1836956 RepID=A0AAD9E808_9PEZI|nr:hypothetical protein CCHR01_16201 [Colletotrichum chrysophilum]